MTRLPNGVAPAIDVIVDSVLWRGQPDAEIVVRRAIATAAAAVSTKDAELAIVLTEDSAIRALNWKWRGTDKSTNVLSFPAGHSVRDVPKNLGDIVIAFETVELEAAAEGKPFSDHLAHLAVHGFLHLLGYDHETAGEANVMERLESSILAQLDMPDPYRMRDAEV
ncbi:MAG: rRNA maturation RNase YbeY [Rhizobiales bacterium]|nr:rRNA maturation RNase YbeY [Hyphomicrobiales bacterium]